MLKRIFKRRKSKKSKKTKKSKLEQLNISTDETNMNTYNLNDQSNEIDDDEDEIDLPKLNFTCILNNPLERTTEDSLFGKLLKYGGRRGGRIRRYIR